MDPTADRADNGPKTLGDLFPETYREEVEREERRHRNAEAARLQAHRAARHIELLAVEIARDCRALHQAALERQQAHRTFPQYAKLHEIARHLRWIKWGIFLLLTAVVLR